MRFVLLMVLTAGCAPTRGPAPGGPLDESIVVTYYYLNF